MFCICLYNLKAHVQQLGRNLHVEESSNPSNIGVRILFANSHNTTYSPLTIIFSIETHYWETDYKIWKSNYLVLSVAFYCNVCAFVLCTRCWSQYINNFHICVFLHCLLGIWSNYALSGVSQLISWSGTG